MNMLQEEIYKDAARGMMQLEEVSAKAMLVMWSLELVIKNADGSESFTFAYIIQHGSICLN